ncbi:MAG: DUF2157 domain-containing protein [Nanoarchaeota archaeon]
MDKELISKWLRERVINQAQAKRMLADVKAYKKESSSNKFIAALSTIGAILLGIGAILFIASNWQELSSLAKTIILVSSTAISYYIGYLFRYQKKNLPKVGSALLFLGALLFGATIILVTQIYNLNANNHILVLIWLIGILPLVYALKSMPIAGLASLLFYLWIGLFFSSDNSWFFFGFLGRFTIILFITGSIMLFAIGGLHYLSNKFKDIARTYRIASLKVLMVSLFLLTFDWFSKLDSYRSEWFNEVQGQITIGIVIFSIIAIIISIVNWFFNKSQSLAIYEGPISIALIGLILIFFFYPSETSIYVLIFNLLFAVITLLFLYLGYHREDMTLVNLGMFWMSIFLIAKYFDWFWELLERSTFFLIGGIILVLGSIVLEKKRRQIKAGFTSKR